MPIDLPSEPGEQPDGGSGLPEEGAAGAAAGPGEGAAGGAAASPREGSVNGPAADPGEGSAGPRDGEPRPDRVLGPNRPPVDHTWQMHTARRRRRRSRPRPGSPQAERDYQTWIQEIIDQVPAGWTPAERAADPQVRALRALSAHLPGAELAARAGAIDDERVTDEVLREKLRANQRLINWLTSEQADIIAAMDRRQSGAAALYLEEEVAAALAITSYAAGRLTDRAQALTECPELRQGLHTGRIDARKTDVLIEGTETLDGAQARAVHRALLPVAEVITSAQLRKRVATAALAVDPQAARERHQKAAATRTVSLTPAADGMAWIHVFLPAPEAMAAFTALDALAGPRREGDDRPVGARRVDAFGQILTETLNTGRTPGGCVLGTRQGMRPRLTLTMGAGTLSGANDAPAYLDGYGPVDAHTAREIARGCVDPRLAHTDRTSGGLIGLDRSTAAPSGPGPAGRPTTQSGPGPAERTTTDPTGRRAADGRRSGHDAPALIAAVRDADAGRDPVGYLEDRLGLLATDAYSPSARLRQFILARDRTCRFPTCEQPAVRCQIDHIEPFTGDAPAWAQTVQSNLHVLCTRHHQMKTSGAWTVSRGADGTTCWTSPMGARIVRPAEVVDVEWQAARFRQAMASPQPDPSDGDLVGPIPVDPGTSEASNPANLADAGLSMAEIRRRLMPRGDPAGPSPDRGRRRVQHTTKHRGGEPQFGTGPTPAYLPGRPGTGHRPDYSRRAPKSDITAAAEDPEHPPY